MPVVIHAGLPRTGTTTLQTHLFARHSEVHYLGIYKGRIATRRTRRWSQCRDPRAAELMKQLAFDGLHASQATRAETLWREIRAEAAGKTIVWSWESLAANFADIRERRARGMAGVMGPATVLVVLRHPVHLMESTYFQILRRNNRPLDTKVWYQPIDAWLTEHLQGELDPLLDYERTIDIYSRWFGADAVHVMLFEELRDDLKSFVARTCRVMGIDEREGEAHTTGRHENATSAALIERVRGLEGRFLGWLRARLAVSAQLRGRMRPVGGADTPRIGPEGRRLIAERTSAGNRRLAERLNLDRERWDYPL